MYIGIYKQNYKSAKKKKITRLLKSEVRNLNAMK